MENNVELIDVAPIAGVKVETGIEKIPATNGSICDMDAETFVKSGLKVGAFAGVAYLATRAVIGVADAISGGFRAAGAAAAQAASNAAKAAAEKEGQ